MLKKYNPSGNLLTSIGFNDSYCCSIIFAPCMSNNDNKNVLSARFAPVIDQSFVNEFYSAPTHNKKLWDALENKNSVAVLFPDPIKLTEQFCDAVLKLVSLLENNEVCKELLMSRTTYENYFTVETEDAKTSE